MRPAILPSFATLLLAVGCTQPPGPSEGTQAQVNPDPAAQPANAAGKDRAQAMAAAVARQIAQHGVRHALGATAVNPAIAPAAPTEAAAAEPMQAAPTPAPTAPPAAAPAQPSPPPAAATGPRHFGAAIPAGARTVRLADVVAHPDRFQGHDFVTEGNVIAVCQHMGCWMEIRDARTQAHIRMHGHSFFIPRDANGKHARVQVTLVAAHPPTECDQTAEEAAGRRPDLELDATGVDVSP